MSSIKLEDFRLLKVIASGANSKVIVAEHKENLYVIKAAKKQKSRVTSHGVTEKNILKLAVHPFITKMFGCFATANHLCFVMEYAAGGDLMDYKDFRGGKLPEKEAVFYSAETAVAINFLHSKNIVHRDVKLKNILIGTDGHIKLADFGSGREMEKEGRTNSLKGTSNYIAPEVLRKEYYTNVIDWWSFGVCLYFLLYGKHPFAIDDAFIDINVLRRDITMKPIEYPECISGSAISLLKGLLNRDPRERLGTNFCDIRNHSFFKEIAWETLEAKHAKPPFIPQLKNSTDFHHFDPTRKRVPDDHSIYSAKYTVEKKEFKDFDYTSPDWKN